jgi:hypothetical protein
METEPSASPSRLVWTLIHWRLITFVTLLALVAAALAITLTSEPQAVCGCGPPDGYNATIERQWTMTALTPASSSTPATTPFPGSAGLALDH